MQSSTIVLVCFVGAISACSFTINGNGGSGGGGGGATTAAPPPPTGSCKCGVANRSFKIVGGVTTEEHEYPWQVGLLSSKYSAGPFCGGSIVSSKEILTAAHCTAGRTTSNTWVLAGGHRLGTTSTKEQRLKVCAIKDHPNYKPESYHDNDFSILELCEEIDFREEVSPVCLPTISGTGSGYEGVNAVVSGWGALSQSGGSPNQLMEVIVKTMSNRQCTGSSTDYTSQHISSNMLCASNPGKDSCKGDSGGPLVTNEGPTSGTSYYLIGVVSWGFGCAQPTAPGVYARVTKQLSWINRNIKGETCSPVRY